jgi:hypothetical protein
MEPIKLTEIRSTDIRIQGPSIIPAIEPPTLRGAEVPVVRGMELPIINMPNTGIKYPTVNVPTQEEFDAAVKAEKEKQAQEEKQKERGLPDAKPVLPQVQVPQITNQENKKEEENNTLTPTNNLGVPIIEVPLIGQVPVPPKEQVILAGTTATASVAAALVGKSLVEWMVKKMKPIVEQLFVRGKKLLNRDLTPYELQIFFAFEKSQSLKKVNKLLKKEQKAEKKEQYKKFHSK